MRAAGGPRFDRGRRFAIGSLPRPRRALRVGLGLLWLAGSGCTALREVPRDQLGARAERKDVRLVTRDGRVYEFDFIRIGGDTLVGYRRRDVEGPIEDYATLSFAFDDVGSLRARQLDWVRTGLIGGVVAAGIVGVGLARSGSSDKPASGGTGKPPIL